MTTKQTDLVTAPRTGLLARVAERYGVDAEKMKGTLKATAFRSKSTDGISDEQLMMLMVVADQYRLNPFTAELFAFPSSERGIVPIVSIDGWVRIVNEHPQLQGFGFKYDDDGQWIECSIERKDRSQPIVAREYLTECKRDTGPWRSHPQRMLRHKAFIQCARLAFGFAGIYDPDEGERIIEGEVTVKPATDRPVERVVTRAALDGPAPVEAEVHPREEETQPVGRAATPKQLALLRNRIAEIANLHEDQVCAHFDVTRLEELEFDTIDVALAYVRGRK